MRVLAIILNRKREYCSFILNFCEILLKFEIELPWMAGTQSAEFVSELGYFWNYWACKQRNIVLIVCGSATSWMLENVIHDYGGLHGRLTEKMQLLPFTLNECEQYFKAHHFRMYSME